jgi:hypothetical protein
MLAEIERADSWVRLKQLLDLLHFNGSLVAFRFPEITRAFLQRADEVGGANAAKRIQSALYGISGPATRGYTGGASIITSGSPLIARTFDQVAAVLWMTALMPDMEASQKTPRGSASPFQNNSIMTGSPRDARCQAQGMPACTCLFDGFAWFSHPDRVYILAAVR